MKAVSDAHSGAELGVPVAANSTDSVPVLPSSTPLVKDCAYVHTAQQRVEATDPLNAKAPLPLPIDDDVEGALASEDEVDVLRKEMETQTRGATGNARWING